MFLKKFWRIQKFTSEGVFVSKWGTEGAGDGQFNYHHGVAVASDGSVYVGDLKNHSISDDLIRTSSRLIAGTVGFSRLPFREKHS